MDIAAMSTAISNTEVQQSFSIGLAKKVMDSTEQNAVALLEGMMEATPAPSQYNFDTYA
ncbi:MAG: YjfB family protein [Eubacteriales bacterium]